MVGTVTAALQALTYLWALRLALCCTIYEFNGSGFAANAFAIVHMVPIFHNTNGTFFLDNTKNFYKCSEDGGWHDFFAWEDQLVPWTAEREAQEPDAPCVRHDISTVNKVVFEDLKLTWDELDFIGVKKARSTSQPAHARRPRHRGLGCMHASMLGVSACPGCAGMEVSGLGPGGHRQAAGQAGGRACADHRLPCQVGGGLAAL
jgi:hypothetical protein